MATSYSATIYEGSL